MAKQETTQEIRARMAADAKKLLDIERTAAKDNFSSAMQLMRDHATHWSEVQRERLIRFLSPDDVKPAPKKAAKKTGKKSNTLKGTTVPPKYRLPTGEEWTGRGHWPVAFVAFGKKNGITKARRKSGAVDFPLINGAAAATKSATKKVSKAPNKKSAKAPAKKATKKAAKKSSAKKVAVSE